MRALVLLLVLLVTACGDDAATSAPPPTTSERESPSSTAAAPATTVTAVPTTEAAPAFVGRVEEVTEADLGASWRPGCPVGPGQLRRLVVTHVDAEGAHHDGELVVHVDHAAELLGVFETLWGARFPVASMRPVTEFGADDDRSMAADNTSAFNCREIAGGPGVWSEHAYGRAVDINPLVNPYVAGDVVLPPTGSAYLDRSTDAPGLIRAGDVVTEAFAAIGWTWGGDWTTALDYQHFSSTGR